MSKIQTGKDGENRAVEFLKNHGFKILETNFKTKFGEIDIVAIDKDTLVFIEVKTRSSIQFGLPEEAVDQRKLSHIIKAAQYYRMLRKNLPEAERIDVIAIETNTGRTDLIKNVTG